MLDGPDVAMPGGRSYTAGDRVVALAPDPLAGVVTSERFTILAVRPDVILALSEDDHRELALIAEMLDADHLDHAYALTIHRSQGATYDRAHVLAAGGGRELAYVALSRARHGTTIHATADDLEQAIDDLATSWGVDRHQSWISDTPATVGWDFDDPVRRIGRRRDPLEHQTPDIDHGIELEL